MVIFKDYFKHVCPPYGICYKYMGDVFKIDVKVIGKS